LLFGVKSDLGGENLASRAKSRNRIIGWVWYTNIPVRRELITLEDSRDLP